MLEQVDEGDQDEVEVGGSMIYQCSMQSAVHRGDRDGKGLTMFASERGGPEHHTLST